jgi:hypothetical protein
MRTFIQSPDTSNFIDPPVATLLNHLPRTDRWEDADCLVVPITRVDRFRFNEELRRRVERKPWCAVEFSEFFWSEPFEVSHIWGRNMLEFPWYQQNPDWQKLDQLFRDKPPVMTWQRELLQKDVTPLLQPMEWLSLDEVERPQSKDEFYSRPIGVLHTWGRSHEARVQLHGDIFKGSSHFGYDAVGQYDYLDEYVKRGMPMWGAIHVPDTKRAPMSTFYHWARRSKLVTSWPGCGFKCVRHGEAPNASIMVLPANPLAWTYPWVHGENACVVDIGTGVETLDHNAVPELYEFLKRDDLHEIYRSGLETAAKYRPDHFYPHHWIPTLQAKL